MKRPEPINSLILTIRGIKVLIDADLATIYGVKPAPLTKPLKGMLNDFLKTSLSNLTQKKN